MNTSAEAADQIVRMSLNGTETVIKLTGTGAKEMAKLLYKLIKDISKEKNKTRGQMRLANLIKSGKQLDIYKVPDKDMKLFCTEAKKYGMVYTILKDRNATDGMTEIMAKADDRAKIEHIMERLGNATVTYAKVETGVTPPERNEPETVEAEKFIADILATPNHTKEEVQTENPTQARTSHSQSVPSSKAENESREFPEERSAKKRHSVRKELAEIKAEQERRRQNEKVKDRAKDEPFKVIEHKTHERKKKDKER